MKGAAEGCDGGWHGTMEDWKGRRGAKYGRARMSLDDVKGGRHGWEARVRGRARGKGGTEGERERRAGGKAGRQGGAHVVGVAQLLAGGSAVAVADQDGARVLVLVAQLGRVRVRVRVRARVRVRMRVRVMRVKGER